MCMFVELGGRNNLFVCLFSGGGKMMRRRYVRPLSPRRPRSPSSVCSSSSTLSSLTPSSRSLSDVGTADISNNLHEVTPWEGNTSQFSGNIVKELVEFSYKELFTAANGFSIANKICEGNLGAVYYAELRGEKAAIKKKEMQASREFIAELKILMHVHHLNMVRLIGYCTEGSLFLVYEYIENGNLHQHLRESGRDALPWSIRVQIALDSASCLENIHEHTIPVYVHRNINPTNILIDKNFHGKVAGFGLIKELTEVGNESLPNWLVGTYGYIPPEYVKFGDISPKVDVYAFGVVLYELISAKAAVVKEAFLTASMELVALFEDALGQPDPKEHLQKLVDPRLDGNFPIDSVHKMALLAKACMQENPQLRPSMRSIVVALMKLSAAPGDLDISSY